MRILFISDFYPPYIKGGAEISTSLLADYLAKDNQVYVVCTKLDDKKWIRNQVEVYPVISSFRLENKDLISSLKYAVRIITRPIASIISTRNLINKLKPDVVNIVPSSYHFIPIIIWLRIFKGLPVVVDARDYSIICPTHLGSEVFDDTVYRSHGYRCLKSYNTGNIFLDLFSRPFALYESMVFNLYKTTLKFIVRHFSGIKIIAVSDYMKRQLVLNGFCENKIGVIYNAPASDFLDYEPVDMDVVTFSYAGRIQKAKGALDFVYASRELFDKGYKFKVNIAGVGEDFEELSKYVSDNNLKSVSLLGNIKPEEVINLYKKSTVVVAPSRWPEPLGRFTLEAMVVGRPVITTFSGGASEIIENGVNGFLVEAGDVKKLSEIMEGFIKKSYDIDPMIKNIIRKREDFSISVVGPKRLELYKGFIS